MKKITNRRGKDEKEAILQIALIFFYSIAIAYFAHATAPLLETITQYRAEERSEIYELFSYLNKPLLPMVDAAQESTSYSSGTNSGVSEQCCLETNFGALCQSIASVTISNVCDPENIVPTSCDQVSTCEIGCCQDPVEGVCSARAPKGTCEAQGGIWNSDENCNIPVCENGCCALGSNTQYTTEQRCTQLSSLYGFDKDFRQVDSELECLALAPTIGEGACVVGESCKFGTAQECLAREGAFYLDKLCSNEELDTNCEKQNHVGCVEGKDEIYWFDSCGNRENIYSSDKEESWNSGEPLNKNESCNPLDSNSGSANCGNCNRFLGSMCASSASVVGNQSVTKVKEGDFICRDLRCEDEKGKQRENGESWCVYDGYIGDGKDVVGSRHWKQICIDGIVQVEPCSDYRGQICVEGELEGERGDFSSAACVVNPSAECITYNQNPETVGDQCKENIYCQLTEVDVDEGFTFEICTGKYPIGFDVTGNDQRSLDSANQICAMANQECIVIYEKKISGWECIMNCECETETFTEEMNNLCTALGDCGTYVNIAGQGTNNIEVENAPTISWNEYTKYATPVDGQKADPESLESLAKKLGFIGIEDPDGVSAVGNVFGMAGKVAGIGGMIANGVIFTSVAYVSQDLTVATVETALGQFGGVLGGVQAIGTALGALSLGMSISSFLSFAFGLTGQAAQIMTIAGAIGGAAIGITSLAGGGGILSSIGALLPGGVACFDVATCTVLLIVIIVLIIIAVVLKVLGVGETKEVIVKFTCMPWQAPTGGDDCEICNQDSKKACSNYRCSSLGQACELINLETTNPICIATSTDDNTPPKIFPINVSEGFRLQSTESGVVVLQGQSITGNAISDSSCTQVIGFSQTEGWYNAGFENNIENGKWQLLWQSGADITQWAKPSFSGWNANLVSPCSQNSNAPDRVVLTISGEFNNDPGWWVGHIQQTITTIKEKYPSVQEIILQPVVGGPQGAVCTFGGEPIRASSNHPVIDQAIAQIVNGNDILVGASPEVSSCNQFKDALGHLTSSGYSNVAQKIAAVYQAGSIIATENNSSSGSSSGSSNSSSSTSTNTNLLQNNVATQGGVSVRTLNGECIPEFTPVITTLGTDERAQCKFSLTSGIGFEDKNQFGLEGTAFTDEHNFGFVAPSLSSLQNSGAEITGDIKQMFANINYYVSCQDVNGNANTKEYLINFCVQSGPDITAPRVLITTPVNGAGLKNGVSSLPILVRLNEPAECKYDYLSGKPYDSMSNSMNCHTEISGGNWTCVSTLSGLTNDVNNIYLKCRDQPWYAGTNESARNTNVEDYVYTLYGTKEPLTISSITPQGIVSGGVEPISVKLEVETAGGVASGDSICSYSFVQNSAGIGFFRTGGNKHEQTFQMVSKPYQIFVSCKDDAGNIATGESNLQVQLDTQPPQVVRVFRDNSKVKLTTNEPASCVYSLSGCSFNIENGTLMTTAFSTQHETEFNPGKTLFVKCVDLYNNKPNQCTIQITPTA